MSTSSMMQRPHQELQPNQQPRSFGHYTDSNPSSTHSSPRSYPSELENFYPSHPTSNLTHSQTYPIPAGAPVNPYVSAQQRRPPLPHMQPSRSSSYSSYTAPVSLQVSTSTSSAHEHDPNERTARPGNAHVHAQFHSSLSAAVAASSSSNSMESAPGATSGDAASLGNAEAGAGGESDSTGGQQADFTSSTPGLSAGLSRPLKPIEQERLAHLDRLKYFLATAPSRWDNAAANANPAASSSSGFGGDYTSPYGSGTTAYGGGAGGGYPSIGLNMEPPYHHAPPHPALNRFLLPNQEFVTCVLWNGLYHITGTDIVRALVFRFEAFGRPVRNMKKFEEGVFSDLRNLKPGVDACLEEPKSPFLDLLFKYQCIRTQKKQKVFYWFSVPHDRLFLDALERDLKREKMGLEPTTQVVGEPALSFTYDPKRSLYEQFSKAQTEGDSEKEGAGDDGDNAMDDSEADGGDESGATGGEESDSQRKPRQPQAPSLGLILSLFEGSPSYKQRRKKGTKASSLRKGSEDEYERGRSMGSVSASERFASLSQSRERSARPSSMPRFAHHTSMMEEFGPGSAAAAAAQAEELTAADMFLMQAKGQLTPGDGVVRKPKPQPVVGEVGVYYHQDPAGAQQRLTLGGGHMRGRSIDETTRDAVSQNSRPSGSVSAGYTTTTFADNQQSQTEGQPGQPIAQGQQLTSISQYEAVSADGKIRAFVCPLYSCGRLFKRMEHLKRHLRTHTMERPFTCTKCNKKFSRSDNLTQHLRTHERTGHGPLPGTIPGTTGNDNWMDSGEDGDVSASEGSNNGGSPRATSVGADGEDDGSLQGMVDFGTGMGGLNMFGDASGLGMGAIDMSAFAMLNGAQGFDLGQLDASMCEVEVPGGIQDVSGDEDGMIIPGGVDSSMLFTNQQSASDGYFSSLPSSAATSGMLFSASTNSTDFSPDNAQWASRPSTSSAFPNVAPRSLTSSPAGYIRTMQAHHSHSSSSSASSNFGDEYSTASLSAPSHKQTFDHASLFSMSLMDNATNSHVGPMRRHRSMTPSLARNGEPIRRPTTANSEFSGAAGGSPASVSSLNAAMSRAYHPYAYSTGNSRANSTTNSPQVHSVPLGNEYVHAQIHRSESRNSNYGGLHEQMRQMMNMNDGSTAPAAAAAASTVFGDALFRAGSPAPFQQTDSPAAFNVDLPLQFSSSPGFMGQQQGQGQMHAATMPVGNGQFGTPGQQQGFDGFFGQQHHATL
ncbi:hypothetical protein CVT26_004261 [Gymnopilus dilepis]|uniref:C2H2-type domain-containing protein n=1 Tax=Gymnopilus dilepis TaxID=231916 RepID=A0A409WTS0_9AGAR|nr:hypothetical protein CVT26_004261 [Gymnopilus dilepis]